MLEDKLYKVECELESKEYKCDQKCAELFAKSMAMKHGLDTDVSVKSRGKWRFIIGFAPSEFVKQWKADKRMKLKEEKL